MNYIELSCFDTITYGLQKKRELDKTKRNIEQKEADKTSKQTKFFKFFWHQSQDRRKRPFKLLNV